MKMLSTVIILLVNLFSLHARVVPEPPKIIKQPPSDEILVRNTFNDDAFAAVIECEAIGEPMPKYRWIKNGKPFNWEAYDDRISQQIGRGTLTFITFEESDIGQYQCFAENEFGVATANTVFLRKSFLSPFKDVPILSLNVTEGEPFKLHCQPPDGILKPKINWIIHYATGEIKYINNSRTTVDPEGTLWFSAVAKDDSSDDFLYACVAYVDQLEYKLGRKVHLNVIPSGLALPMKHAPVLQYATGRNEVAMRERKIELFCIFSGLPLPTIVWSKDGKAIKPSDLERVVEGNYGKSLIIKPVEFDDEGTYTCNADNGVGESLTHSINVHVLSVPYFTSEPEFINAAEDETAEIECVTSGKPDPNIKWVHNGKPIEEVPPNARRTVEKNKIVIQNLTKADIGNYGCNATNALGYIYKDVYVNVLAMPPEFIQSLRDQQVFVGEDISLSCNVFGTPRPIIKWFYNNNELNGNRSGDLHIKNVTFEDSGQYKCIAKNKFGEATAELTLTVKAPVKM